MPEHEFVFALDLSDQSHYDRMLITVARTVLGHVGYDRGAIEAIVALIRDARPQALPAEPCHVRFEAHAGELQILVSCAGHQWQTRRPLP